MNDLAVLHLSDLHIDSSTCQYSKILKGLIADIKKEIKSIPNKGLVIVVTGDIIHKGKKEFVPAAIKFFEDLYKVTAEKVATIYVVPGNHDKFRTKENAFLIPAYRMLNYFSNEGFGDVFYGEFWKYQLDAYSEELGSGYFTLIDKIYEIFDVKDSVVKDTFGVSIANINNKKFCFVLLNTAWSCMDDTESRKLILGDFQVNEIKKQYNDKVSRLEEDEITLTIVLGHHPISLLYGKDEDKIFSEMISFEELNANVYMCGHTHDRTVINWVNNRHSINTFMTGIGWPEAKEAQHAGMHTYSIYVFNLDANSIDIYVRSTNDGGSFVPDFRLYTNEVTRDNKKIVFPIKAQDAQTYISLSSGPERSSKAYYISKDFLQYMHDYVVNISRLRQNIGMKIESDKNELYENIDLNGLECSESSVVEQALYTYFFSTMEDLEEDENFEKIINDILVRNKNIIYEMFMGYLQQICEKLGKFLLCEQTEDSDVIRFHFRFLSDRKSLLYKKLCSSFLGTSACDNYELSDIKYGELIEAAFKTGRGLIYSANKDFCENPLKEKWTNFLTAIPLFEGNLYSNKRNELLVKEYPFITFGVTTNSKKFDILLYCMDHFSINIMLKDMIDAYIEVFKIDINKFCEWVKTELRKEI